MATGAPPISLSVDGREFQCLNESAGNPEQGGYDGEFQSNGAPDTGRLILTPTGWGLADQAIELDVEQKDWEYLNDKKNSGQLLDIVVTYYNAVYGGRGYITGKLAFDPMAASGSISFMGPGKFEQQ
jgi:hypothetical protein